MRTSSEDHKPIERVCIDKSYIIHSLQLDLSPALHKCSHGSIHSTDVEVSRFFAKLVVIKDPDRRESISANSVVIIHSALIERLRATEPQLADKDSERENALITGGLHFHHKQRGYHKLEPLFRALLIIVDKPTIGATTQIMHLIRTRVTNGLSSPYQLSKF